MRKNRFVLWGICLLTALILAGAGPQEIIDDYMITYENYYRITKAGKPE